MPDLQSVARIPLFFPPRVLSNHQMFADLASWPFQSPLEPLEAEDPLCPLCE